jgi:hypothetical protein
MAHRYELTDKGRNAQLNKLSAADKRDIAKKVMAMEKKDKGQKDKKK